MIRPVAKDGGGGTGHAPPHQIRVPRQLISFEIIFQFLFCIFFYLSNIAETGMVVTSIGLIYRDHECDVNTDRLPNCHESGI